MHLSKPLYLSGFVVLIFYIFATSVPLFKHGKLVLFSKTQRSDSNLILAPRRNVWADLSEEEAQSVRELLFSRPELNLTQGIEAGPYDNTLRLVEILQPNKTEVLSYFNSESGPPERWVRAVINEGAGERPQIVNYMVVLRCEQLSASNSFHK